MKSVILSVKAEADLENIGDYIAADNPSRALSFIKELRGKCIKLGHYPEANPRFPELGPDVRFCPHGSYLILYRVLEDSVSVERILHGARDIMDVIGSEE